MCVQGQCPQKVQRPPDGAKVQRPINRALVRENGRKTNLRPQDIKGGSPPTNTLYHQFSRMPIFQKCIPEVAQEENAPVNEKVLGIQLIHCSTGRFAATSTPVPKTSLQSSGD